MSALAAEVLFFPCIRDFLPVLPTDEKVKIFGPSSGEGISPKAAVVQDFYIPLGEQEKNLHSAGWAGNSPQRAVADDFGKRDVIHLSEPSVRWWKIT